MNIQIIQQEALDATRAIFDKYLIRNRTELTEFDKFIASQLLDGSYAPGEDDRLGADLTDHLLKLRFGADQMLRIFIYMVEAGITPPPAVMRFMAGGAREYLRDGKPWQVNNSKMKPPHSMALALIADEYHPGNRTAIASHLDIGTKALSNWLKPSYDHDRQLAARIATELDQVLPPAILSNRTYTLLYIEAANQLR